MRWRTKKRYIPLEPLPPVTILKPLCGVDPHLEENLRSFFSLDWPHLQIICGALDAADPALAVAQKVAADYPHVDIEIVAGPPEIGLNRKVANLVGMLPHSKHDLIVLCDSDMRARPEYLERVTAPFADPGVGLVTCLYRGVDTVGLASKLEAIGIGAGFAPSVLVAALGGSIRFAFGSTIAMRKSDLAAMGGFEALKDELADDYLLGAGVSKLGKRVELSDYVIDDVMGRQSLRDMWKRRLRWAKTVRAMQPAGYAGSFVTYTTAISMLAATANGFQSGWLIACGALIGLRILCVSIVAALIQQESVMRNLLLLPVSDLLDFALWVASYFGREIEWRGQRYRLGDRGRLEKLY